MYCTQIAYGFLADFLVYENPRLENEEYVRMENNILFKSTKCKSRCDFEGKKKNSKMLENRTPLI